jgi:DNA gyrase subunit A
VALNNLDAVIELIRKASDADEARGKLMKRFELSEVQANAILDMPLRRLAALERKKIETEYKEVQALIKGLEDLLASPKKVRSLVAKELEAVKAAYADRRRTQIVTLGKGEVATEMLTAHALETGRPVWVAINAQGQVARSEEDKAPRPSGKDAPRWLLRASSRDTLFLVTANGKAAALPIHALPQANSPAGGESINRVSALKAGDALAAVFALPPHGERPPAYLLTVTEAGIVKKSEIAELPGPGSQAFRLANVKAGDKLISAVLTDGTGELFLASASGLGIRFKEEEVRSMGLTAAGVAGIRLEGKDRVVGAVALNVNEAIFLLATDGRAKRVSPEQFPLQGRHGKGVIAWKLEEGIQLVGIVNQKGTTRATIHLKRLAAKAVRLDEAPLVSRQANGKPLVEMRDDDEVVALVNPSFAASAGPARLHAQGGSPEQPRQKRPAASKPKPKKK